MSLLRELTKPIADKIRFFLNVDDLIPPSQFDKKIDEVYDAGKRAECEEWENRVHGSDRTFYIHYFSNTDWNGYEFKKTLKPSKFVAYSIGRMFYNYAGTELPRNIDLSGATQNSIRTIDSPATAVQLFTWSTKVLEIPDYKLPPLSLYGSFNYLRSCHTIEKIRIDESCIPPSFVDCNSLVNVNFEGTIAGDIALPSSPLSIPSLKSVIKHLKNYNETDKADTYTVTFKASAFEALETIGLTEEDNEWLEDKFSADKDFIEGNGWGWAELIGLLGWELSLNQN